MTTNIKPITELDFDLIKQDIVEYIKTNQTFSDYNFEGSALNALIDILAYSTHTNAYYANMIHNESFLDTAQKRSSVVSIAKELGYVPASVVCSTAYVNVNVTGVSTNLYLDKGQTFSAYNENGNFSFVVSETVEGSYADNTVVFTDVKLLNGVLASNTFTVDTTSNIRGMYTIPNKNIDTSSLSVYVKDSASSTSKTYFVKSSNAYELISNSKVFFLQESYDGYYQIYFGNDILGEQPKDGNVIVVEYIVATSSGISADGCRTFSPNFSFSTGSSVSVVTTQNSFGYKPQETIESIRSNSVKNNSAKNRTVTEDDYRTLLMSKFPFVKNCIVWGGEKNVPPVYGKVFASLQPVSGYSISEATKSNIIIPEISKNSMLTVTHEIVDPEYLPTEFVVKVKFNKFKTTSSSTEVAILIKDKIKTFMDDLATFGLNFYNSTLVSQLVYIDPGVVSVNLKKTIGFNITPLINVNTLYERNISNEIKEGSITSDPFDCSLSGKIYRNCVIKEIDNTVNLSRTESLGIYSVETSTLIQSIGTVNLTSGYMKFNINLVRYINSKNHVSIRCSLVNDDISTLKNQILVIASSMDSSLSKDDITVLVENYVQ